VFGSHESLYMKKMEKKFYGKLTKKVTQWNGGSSWNDVL